MVCLQDIAWCDDVVKAVRLGHLSTLLTLTTDHENSTVFVGELPHRGVATDELARADLELQLFREIATALLF
ncbi:hypothetical protein FJTKL_10658 [Diaporthe vaccinii]|uniref:Alkaline phosphatase n=1 Tax=Diaporthe vaccinii TaxID=105482 RepID=A0ABR4FB88_9PEZI